MPVRRIATAARRQRESERGKVDSGVGPTGRDGQEEGYCALSPSPGVSGTVDPAGAAGSAAVAGSAV
jgi:hypothetical protein